MTSPSECERCEFDTCPEHAAELEQRDTDPAPPPHLVCSVCGGVVHASSTELVHVFPVCAHWRAARATAVDPDIFNKDFEK